MRLTCARIGFGLYIRSWADKGSNEKDQGRHGTDHIKPFSPACDLSFADAWKWIGGLVGLTLFFLSMAGLWCQLQYLILPIISGRKAHQAQLSSRQFPLNDTSLPLLLSFSLQRAGSLFQVYFLGISHSESLRYSNITN